MVFEAGNADEAITTIETGIPIDLVLTDIRMPGSMNGFGLAKWISANKPKISVILAQERPRKQMQQTNFVITSRFSKSHTI